MKKIIAMVLVMAIGGMMIYPSAGYSQPFDRDRGYNRPMMANHYNGYNRQPVRYERSRNDNSGLIIAGVAVGAIALAAIIGSAMSQPRQAVEQQVVYSNPSYGSQSYAQPSGYATETPPGQWVTVQGQWVNGQWVPAHNVWVPVNP